MCVYQLRCTYVYLDRCLRIKLRKGFRSVIESNAWKKCREDSGIHRRDDDGILLQKSSYQYWIYLWREKKKKKTRDSLLG